MWIQFLSLGIVSWTYYLHSKCQSVAHNSVWHLFVRNGHLDLPQRSHNWIQNEIIPTLCPQDTWLTCQTGQLSQLCAHQQWDQQVADPKHKSLSCNYCKLHLSVLMNTVVQLVQVAQVVQVVQVVQFTSPDVSTNKCQYIPLTLHGLCSSHFCSWLHQL